MSLECPGVSWGAHEYHSNVPASGGGHSSVTRISLSQEVKCHSSAPGSGWGVRMPEGRGEWVSFECPRFGTRPRLAQIRPGPRQDQPSLSQSALSQSALGCPARPSLTQPDSGPHQGRAQFQLAWPLPGSAQLRPARTWICIVHVAIAPPLSQLTTSRKLPEVSQMTPGNLSPARPDQF